MTKTYRNKKQRWNSFLVALMSVMLCLSFCFTACTDSTDDDDQTTVTNKTDTQKIANGNFEFFSNDDGTNLVISPSNWTKSVGTDGNGNSASSSTTASGIVNTEKSAWDNLTTSNTVLTESNASKLWDSANVYDHLAFYEEFDISDSDDFEDYVDYNIDLDDVPSCVNPGTRSYDATQALSEEDEVETHVLMIHNTRSDNNGTAQKYTSSTKIELEANTSATFSVWVKTAELTYNAGTEVNGNRGAYIGVTHTVGGTTLDQMQIMNIDTKNVTENNGWVEYTVYLKACSYAPSTFTVVLGLGQGGGSDKFEYVQGYAFFDDVTCKLISNEAYDEATQANGVYTVPYTSLFNAANEKKFDTSKEYANDHVYAIDLYQGFSTLSVNAENVSIALTEETRGDVTYVTSASAGKQVYKNLNIATANDVVALTTLDQLSSLASGNSYLDKIVSNDFAEVPFDSDSKTLLLMSANGAPYTAKMINGDAFTLAPDAHVLVSFWVKTSDMNGFTGATVTLKDGANDSVIGDFDTTTLDTVDIDDATDLYNGWKQCFFFVSNETSSVKEFYLEFSYGTTTILGTTAADYIDGYACFTNFEIYSMTSEENGFASTDEYAVSASLTGDFNSKSATAGFDDVAYSGEELIEDTIATPKNYNGVEGGSSYVVKDGHYGQINQNEYAGLINSNYAENYVANECEWLQLIASAENISLIEAVANWTKIFGDANQPLVIANAVDQAYGYISKSVNTIATAGYTSVSVRVKVSAGAVAYVYLVDASDLSTGYADMLSVTAPALTYWYDDDGNVCSVDPSDDEFNSRTDVVYYRLEETNLYEGLDGKTYANLANYGTDKDGNLITSDTEEIVFYNNNGKFYAYYDETKQQYTTEVLDFDHQYARYDYSESNSVNEELVIVVDGNDASVAGKWVTVSFNIQTGENEKDYRLEVWSGSRDGSVKSAAGSYVLFDEATPESLSDNYNDLLAHAIDNICDEVEASGNKPEGFNRDDLTWYDGAIYYTFSWYDSANYVRYDETLDTDEVGNHNADYVQSDYSESLIYLYYEDTVSREDECTYSVFANYLPVEQSYEAEISSDNDDSSDEDDDEEVPYNVWLLVSSIVLCVAILIALCSVLIRVLIKNAQSGKSSEYASAYNSSRKNYVIKNAEETEEPETEVESDENDPYNGENN